MVCPEKRGRTAGQLSVQRRYGGRLYLGPVSGHDRKRIHSEPPTQLRGCNRTASPLPVCGRSPRGVYSGKQSDGGKLPCNSKASRPEQPVGGSVGRRPVYRVVLQGRRRKCVDSCARRPRLLHCQRRRRGVCGVCALEGCTGSSRPCNPHADTSAYPDADSRFVPFSVLTFGGRFACDLCGCRTRLLKSQRRDGLRGRREHGIRNALRRADRKKAL